MIRNLFLLVLLVSSSIGIAKSSAQAGDSFRDRIAPILERRCLGCHNDQQQEGEFSLQTASSAMADGHIVPRHPQTSRLLDVITPTNGKAAMPKDADPLSVEEVRLIREWIEGGAEWPDDRKLNALSVTDKNWWSFTPLTEVELPKSDKRSYTNPIDRFIQAKLQEHGLSPSPAADRRTLIRRLSFDLTGLPPTVDEIEAFCRDDSPNAYSELVDRLLESPRYGERWARHWLDVVHYGDTHGYDKDKPRPYAWPYRDYVIRAFNADKPYARFVEEQIAGDVLWPNTVDGIEAMGFVSAGPWDFIGHSEVPETKTDGKIARHLDRDDMVANTIGTFCSVTIHCAQCHNHKFDPITQEDYYRLQAVFSALDRTEHKYYRDDATQQKFVELSKSRSVLEKSLEEIETLIQQRVGDEYLELSKRIVQATQSDAKRANQSEAFGYHSAVAKKASDEKWVQVDLGGRTDLRRIVLRPCYDDFNSIGAGFGFPIRFRIEVSDDPEFTKGVGTLWERHSETFSTDVVNPGLNPFTTHASKEDGVVGRYVRVTAHKLATRSSDFHFALAELEVYGAAGTNVALGKEVTALDSIERVPRWGKSNLTDGVYPTISSNEDREKLIAERETLILQFADPDTVNRRQALRGELAGIEKELDRLPAPSLAYVGGIHHGKGNFVGTGPTGGKPRPIFLLARGQVTHPLHEVTPGTLAALDFQPSTFPAEVHSNEGKRRVALARWITDPNNPLTWRSIVNRVWLYHFGRGLVDTPNDLGRNGGLPSHPELLDWLAIQFRDGGGSLKKLHKLIVTSETYQQSSAHNAEAERIDSGNSLLCRQNRRRLEAEAIRDAVLTVSGKLDLSMGGPGWQDFVIEFPQHSPHYKYDLADPEDPKTWRRSIYRFVVRSQTQPWMTSLDCADPSMRVDKRNESLSSIQALALLNNGFMLTQSTHFAERVAKASDDVSAQVDIAYKMAFGTEPPELHRQRLIDFTKENGLAYLCRTLFNLHAFTFVD